MTRFFRSCGWLFRGICLAAVVALGIAPSAGALDTVKLQMVDHQSAPGAQLSVLTYNIKGLPWPIASNRAAAIGAIAERLGALRRHGGQPHVVLLQEGFISDAKRIAAEAGYRHAVYGPEVAPASKAPPLGRAFAKGARWSRGEIGESVLDSGLAIMSDYPIVKVERAAFPEGACAGFDCLAAKGVLLAWIKVPGIDKPVLVGDTHLNSRKATGVAVDRADSAFAWQVGDLTKIIDHADSTDNPMILGGDFNIGKSAFRNAEFDRSGLLGSHRSDDLAAYGNGLAPARDSREIARLVGRNKIKLFTRPGRGMALRPVGAWVPFPALPDSDPLSDHAGLVVEYRLTPTT
jgi:endonuclease/exonuclease/phosphatase (EEP) superfamily protein YafD